MRLAYSLLFVAITCLPLFGCGQSSSTQTMEGNDIQSYIDANPEMAARQKARQNPDAPTE